jgi:hypothetical protein
MPQRGRRGTISSGPCRERLRARYGEHVSRRRILLAVAIAAVAVAAALVHRLVTPVPS